MGKSISDILSAGSSADRFRDHLGETFTIVDFIETTTKNGPAVQLLVECADHDGQFLIWAPSVVATQVRELAENGFLPARLSFAEQESRSGNTNLTLAEPQEPEQ